ncbi:hypothetical protein AAC387_Pa02g2850 [Persea americana]
MSSREGKGGGANHVNQACAACKHQRKRCSNCPLAPYFPPGHSQQFENVHRLFGVGNLLKTLKATNKEMWPAVMETIQYQADARRADPVHGCLSIVRQLNAQIAETSKELEKTNEQLRYCRQRDQIFKLQHQLQLQNILGSSSVPMLAMSGYHQSPTLMDLANETYYGGQAIMAAHSQPVQGQGFVDVKPFASTSQTVTECNQSQESSAESMVGETPQIDIKPKNLAQSSATSRKSVKGKAMREELI